MRNGVICIKKDECCSVVANGSYNLLSDILRELKNNYSDNEIKLIEIEEEEFEKIKDDAVKINNKFKGYFDDSMNDFSVSLDKEEY